LSKGGGRDRTAGGGSASHPAGGGSAPYRAGDGSAPHPADGGSAPHPAGGSAPGPRGRIRLCAFDLDGTLLGPDLELGGGVLRAVARLRERSIRAMVVTGRMRRTAEAYALELGLAGSPLVVFNGAMAKETGGHGVWWHEAVFNGAMAKETGGHGVWWHEAVAPELAAEVIEFLSEKGLEPLLFCGDRLLAGRSDPERMALYTGIAQVEPDYVDDLLGRVAGPDPLSPTKIIQVEEVSRMPALYREAERRFRASLNVTTSYPFFLEFFNRKGLRDASAPRST